MRRGTYSRHTSPNNEVHYALLHNQIALKKITFPQNNAAVVVSISDNCISIHLFFKSGKGDKHKGV